MNKILFYVICAGILSLVAIPQYLLFTLKDPTIILLIMALMVSGLYLVYHKFLRTNEKGEYISKQPNRKEDSQ